MKSNDKDLFTCERQAHLYYEDAAQAEKDRIADRNARTRLDEQLRKQRFNERFWHKVKVSILQIICILVVAYTLIYFLWVNHG